MTHSELSALTAALLAGRGFAHKRDISDVISVLTKSLPAGAADLTQAIAVGDDCAAIADGDGYLLLAIEGFVDDFVQQMPWFAGYCGVMVNLSDIAAMGGRPIAVVDALWSDGMDPGAQVLQGMASASQRYGVPIVGGHTNNQSERGQLAVAILGRAKKLLTSFDARAGDVLVMAVDLRGAYQDDKPYWNASTEAPPERLRANLALLPALAESGLCDAAKDISMAGAVGTALMLLECSQVGAVIDIDTIPRPAGVPVLRWLQSFPSFGFIFSVRPDKVSEVIHHFSSQEIACAAIGEVNASSTLCLRDGEARTQLWDWSTDAFICAPKPNN